MSYTPKCKIAVITVAVLITLLVLILILVVGFSGHTNLTKWEKLCHRNISKNRIPVSNIVISCTTIPGNFHALKRTMRSVLALNPRPKDIFINIPTICKRTGEPYQIPSWINDGPFTILSNVEDTGPSTKYLPTLRYLEEQNRNNQPVLIIDDDVILKKSALAKIEHLSQIHPNKAMTFGGKRIPLNQIESGDFNFKKMENVYAKKNWRMFFQKHGTSQKKQYANPNSYELVDIIMGHSTYLIKPKFFNLQRLGDYKTFPSEARFVDDIVISGCLAEQYIPCIVPHQYPQPLKEFHSCCRDLWQEAFRPRKSSALHNTVNRTTHNDDTMLAYFSNVWKQH